MTALREAMRHGTVHLLLGMAVTLAAYWSDGAAPGLFALAALRLGFKSGARMVRGG